MPISRICLHCKKQFFTYPCILRKGYGNYCSLKCFHICKRSFKNENGPTWKGDDVGYRGIHAWINKMLGKPKICWECGTEKSKYYDWANISKKYRRDISDWKRLCRKCHFALDDKTRTRGERNGHSKLTENEVLEIRNLHHTKYCSKRLAKRFNVHPNTIRRIVKRKLWKHIPGHSRSV